MMLSIQTLEQLQILSILSRKNSVFIVYICIGLDILICDHIEMCFFFFSNQTSSEPSAPSHDNKHKDATNDSKSIKLIKNKIEPIDIVRIVRHGKPLEQVTSSCGFTRHLRCLTKYVMNAYSVLIVEHVLQQ